MNRERATDNSSDAQQVKKLVEEALQVLAGFGIPLDSLGPRRKERMAKAFLAVIDLSPGSNWSSAKSITEGHRLRSREILRVMNDRFEENIADSSYDDIRRKDLLLPVEAGIVLKSAGNTTANTNDGNRAYALNPEFAPQVRLFGSPAWDRTIQSFMQSKTNLAEELRKTRALAQIPVALNGQEIRFSPGPHNQLQRKVIEEFLPRFGFGAEVLYVGDTADKYLFLREDRLQELGFFEIAHEKLPDVLAFSADKNWLFLIEAVHSANPIDEVRKRTLELLTGSCAADIVYVTAFLDRDSFRKFSRDIAWETEAWIADAPDHMIHFNGDKFLGPHLPDR